jgi:hypothetical protein
MNPKKSLENWIRGWLPKEPALPNHQRIRATHAKSHKGVRTVAIISVGVIATALLLAVAFPNPPKQLKQNMYTKTFTDYPYELVSLDVIILYETEADGTWSSYGISPWGGLPTTAYNVTVLIKPSYVNESTISSLNVTDRRIDPGGGFLSYYPGQQGAPVYYEINLMDFWSNRSVWCALNTPVYPDVYDDSTGRLLESINIDYHFVIREIQTNGTRYLFGIDDVISVPVSG